MTQTVDPPEIETLSCGYITDGLRATPSSGDKLMYLFGNADADGWEPLVPIKVRRLGVTLYVTQIGASVGTFNVRLHKNSLDSGNRIFSCNFPFVSTDADTWYKDTDSVVDNAGMERLDPGDKLLIELRSHAGVRSNTQVSDVFPWVDYEPLG